MIHNLDATLAEARRIAGQPITDRLDGKQAEEAEGVIVRLLEATGLDYAEALRLLGAVKNERWNKGFNGGWERARDAYRPTTTTETKGA